MKDAVIVSAVRTAVGKAPKGTLRATRPDDLCAAAIQGALERVPNLDRKEVEDVIVGCAMPEAEQGMNVARLASLRAGMPVEAAAMTVNRFCASGLQAIAQAAERIRAGGAEVILYTLANHGHSWPGSLVMPRDITSQAVNATDLMWDFFMRHPMP
jgi:acetyl-CoA acyltransferase